MAASKPTTFIFYKIKEQKIGAQRGNRTHQIQIGNLTLYRLISRAEISLKELWMKYPTN